MRIVLATDWWPPRVGGIESQVADLAAMLASRGHTVRVLTATTHPAETKGVRVDTIGWRIVNNLTAPDLRRVSDIAAYLEEAAPDVVHSHGMFLSVAVGAILAASRLGIPSISTVHSLLRPWPVFLAGCAVFRLFSNRADLVTAVSAATAGDVKRASGRDAVRIPNGLHLADWRVPRRRTDGVRIAAVTRLAPKKSPIDLIHALREARLRRSDVTLTVAGDGPERPRLEKEAVRLGVRDHVRFLGACSREQVRQLLGDASILVHPGSMEAFGLALLEARAAGVPVVAMAAGGIPDLITHRRHGLLARTRKEFAAAVAELAADDELRQECASLAPRGLEEFDWTRVVEHHEAVYARALEHRHISGRHEKNSAAATI